MAISVVISAFVMGSIIGQSLDLETLQNRRNEVNQNDSSYLDMHTSSSMYCKGSSERLRPDKVPSLLSDSESIDDFPKRAYSVGSKPVPIQSGIGESYAYMEMTKGATDKGKHKANSAPHLVDEIPDEENHLILLSSPNDFPGQDNSRSSTPRSITPSLSKTCDQQDLLMEMDFQNNKSSGSHESLYESHSRTSSFGSKDFRSRTSSGGSKDFHSRTSSFSADFRDRTDSADSMTRHGKGCYIDPFRMRTQTVCQDSLRPRTSSFGPSDMRPRSSSHGNSRFKELSRRLKEKALQHRILDQSKGKKIIKQASKENMSSTKESAVGMSGYIDIDIKTHSETCNKETITRQRKLSEPVHVKKDPLSDEEYIIIKPVTLCSDSEATSVNQPRLAKHVYISPKVETITDHIATSPHIKKSSVNRRDYPSGYFKHSSSSESVSSTSSSDFNTKTRIHKSSPQSMPPSSMSEYFEVIPQNSPCYPSNLVGHTSKTESLEDSYIVYSPNALESTPDSLKNFSYLEKVHTPVNEESHLTFLSMNKIVSPIREEDNEAIFGPKPKVLSKDQTVLKCLKHEYVNVKFDGNKDINTSVTENTDIVSKPKNKFNNMPRKNVLCGTKQTISQSVKYKEEPIDSKKMDERHIEKSDCEVKILMKDLHEYCEISVGVSKDKTESTDLSSISDVDTRYHEMTFPELKKTLNDQNKLERSAKIFPDSTTQKVCLGKSQVKIDGDSCASSVYSDNSNISSFKNDQKVTAPIDVFNLGAKPCSSPVDIKLPKKLSSSPSSDGSSSSQTSTVYLSNDNRKLSQGSVTSLSSLDNQNTRVQLSTTGTVQNLANKPGDRRSYQEHVAGSGDSTNFNLCSRQLSRSSLGSIESQSPGLNYATLDLSTSLEEPGFSTLTSSQISPGGKSMHPHDEHSKIISYAEIDFEKSVISVTSNLKIEEK